MAATSQGTGSEPVNDIATPLGGPDGRTRNSAEKAFAGGPTLAVEDWRTGLGTLAIALLLVIVGLRIVGAVSAPSAEAVQPYAPRGITAQPVASADWFALTVRASGFRPNSTVLVEVEGLTQSSMVADAAGVVDARIELPDRIAVAVRGVALEGGTLQLTQEVGLVRPDETVRDVLLVLLAASAVAAVSFAPRIRARFAAAGAAASAMATTDDAGRP